jgi:hypothetical protein
MSTRKFARSLLSAAALVTLVGCGAAPVVTTVSGPTPMSAPSASAVPTPSITPSITPTPVATPSAKPSPPLTLYAVLEAPTQYAQNTTVAIAGLDGYARAKTHFVPRSIPYIPDSAAVLAAEAHVAAGVVYFVDGRGVVRTLAPSGLVRQVAVFPITQSQQTISFAVSPDGRQLMAAVLTFPAVGKLIPGTGWHQLVGPWTLAVERADAGGATVTLHTWQSVSEPGCTAALCGTPGLTNVMMAGWDAQGPVAVVGSNHAAQYGLEGSDFYGGHFANVDVKTGLPGPMLGACHDTNAGPWSVGVDGTTLCVSFNTTSGKPIASVDSPGRSLWQPALPPNAPFGAPGGFVLSKDGSQLAMDGAVVSRSNVTVPMTEWFAPEGWLDAGTLIGFQRNTSDPGSSIGMAYLHVSDPSHPITLGFKGEFVGLIS